MTAFAKVFVFVCVVLCYAMAQADAPSVKVYPLQHQIADGLLPAIEGILQPGESVNEYNNQLVINASSSTHRQIETLLSQLDKPSRNLLISVRNDSTGISENSNHGIGGGIKTGRVYLGTHDADEHNRGGLIVEKDGVSLSTNREIRHTSTQQSQQLRAIEGHPSWISTGQSVPYRSRDRWGNVTSDYRDADQGFYITARIIGNRVQLDISTRNDALSDDPRERRQGVIDTHRLQTSVSGAIGEWINLGGTQTRQGDNGSSYTTRRTGHDSEWADIAVKIVPVD